MSSRKCPKPSLARAELCLLAGLLIVAGLLPHSAASRDNPSLAGPESTAFEGRGSAMAPQPRSSGPDQAPTVTGITPDSGANNGAVHITDLSGSYFQPGATVKLIKASQPDIPGTPASVVNSSTITCTFDLTGVITGTWDVVVTNPDAQGGTLVEGFTVRAPSHVHFPLVMRNWPPIVSVDINPIADASVHQGYPDVQFGGAKDMWAGYDACLGLKIARSLLRFDFAIIPADAPIRQATLHLYLIDICDCCQRSHQVTAYRATAHWDEVSVTWNNKPGYGEAYDSAWISGPTERWYSFDVTALVRGWMDGSRPNDGLVIRGPESSGGESAAVSFTAREWPGVTYDPYLEVRYADYGAAASESKVPATAPVLEVAPSGSTTRELLGSLREDSEAGAPGIFESTEEARTSD
jgi:hypothetical protein